MEKKVNIPKRGAGRKWAARLKEIGKREPPKDLVEKIINSNNNQKDKKSATPAISKRDLELE